MPSLTKRLDHLVRTVPGDVSAVVVSLLLLLLSSDLPKPSVRKCVDLTAADKLVSVQTKAEMPRLAIDRLWLLLLFARHECQTRRDLSLPNNPEYYCLLRSTCCCCCRKQACVLQQGRFAAAPSSVHSFSAMKCAIMFIVQRGKARGNQPPHWGPQTAAAVLRSASSCSPCSHGDCAIRHVTV